MGKTSSEEMPEIRPTLKQVLSVLKGFYCNVKRTASSCLQESDKKSIDYAGVMVSLRELHDELDDAVFAAYRCPSPYHRTNPPHSRTLDQLAQNFRPASRTRIAEILTALGQTRESEGRYSP